MDADKRFLAVTGGCALVLLVVYFALVMPVQGEVRSLREEQEGLKKKIESALNSSEYHGEVDLKRIQLEVAALEDALAGLKKTLDLRVDSDLVLDPEATNRLIKYKAALEEKRRVLRKKASSADIALPEKFGFPEGEIADADLPPLMRRLDVIALVVGKAIEFGSKEVSLVAPQGADETRKDPLVSREPVTIELQANFDASMRLLHVLNQPADFVALDRVTLESATTEGDLLKVSVVASGLEVHPEAELEVKGTPKPTSGGGRPWVPGR